MNDFERWTILEDASGEDSSTLTEHLDHVVSGDGPPAGVSLTVLHGDGMQHLYVLALDGGTVGRGDDLGVRLTDPTVSRTHARIVYEEERFHLEDLGSANGTFLDGRRVQRRRRLPDSSRIRFGPHTVLQCNLVDEQGLASLREIHREMFVDTLTDTGNRRLLQQRLREEMAYSLRHHQTLGVLLLDLDHFKSVNDEYGHQVGDLVLAEVGRILLDSVREEDTAYRYGGEEFCVLARGVTVSGLKAMGERIRLAIEYFGLPVPGREEQPESTVRVTASLGGACLDPVEMTVMSTLGGDAFDDDSLTGNELVAQADQALYRAKNDGRNRVVVLG